MPENVYGQDRDDPSPRVAVAQLTLPDRTVVAQEGAELAWIELPIVWIHVDEGRPGPHVTDGISRGDEAERWQNNLVAGPHASHEKSRVKRRRAAGRGNGMRHS